MSDEEQTCDNTCMKEGLVCEPTFFPHINNEEFLRSRNLDCEQYVTPPVGYEEVDYPAISGLT